MDYCVSYKPLDYYTNYTVLHCIISLIQYLYNSIQQVIFIVQLTVHVLVFFMYITHTITVVCVLICVLCKCHGPTCSTILSLAYAALLLLLYMFGDFIFSIT